MIDSADGAILVTGASGYLGGLVATALLAHERATLVLPVRSSHTAESMRTRLGEDLAAEGRTVTSDDLERIQVVPLPATENLRQLLPICRELGVDRIVHCAGCMDYYDLDGLQAVNIELTRAFLDLAAELRVRRFDFLSTAFSCGYVGAAAKEELHGEPDADPTEYTRSKRTAEGLVAASGLPYLILRPSIVIGDSRSGVYGGKRYGIYQLWHAAERLLCDRYVPVIHAIAPREAPVHMIHQDAFQAGFLAAFRDLPDGSIIHLASRDETLPTARQLWDSWLDACARPREIHYFDRLEDVPRDKLDRRQRLWVDFTAVNLDISSHRWRFETPTLERLRENGHSVPDATIETVGVCMRRFMDDSTKIQTFLEKYREERSVRPQVFEVGA